MGDRVRQEERRKTAEHRQGTASSGPFSALELGQMTGKRLITRRNGLVIHLSRYQFPQHGGYSGVS